MAKYFRHHQKAVALSPGTMRFVGDKKVDAMQLSVLAYDGARLDEKPQATIDECLAAREAPGVKWININGLHDTDGLQRIGDHYGLHPLVLEDIVNTTQRPKLEDYDDHLYLVLRMFRIDGVQVSGEQVSIIIGPGHVLSFQEREGDVFDPIRERIRGGKGRIRKMGADYLAYALLDAIVDGYFVVLDKLSEKLEGMEARLEREATQELLQEIYQAKRDVVLFRRHVWPLREACATMLRGESKLIRKETLVFIRDAHDHTFQVIDAVESFRDVISGLQDLYLTAVSNRMNEVMKVLTVIATIFVPLTFVAGIYGMNFQFMPELSWRWGYPLVWLVIFAVAATMLTYFKKKHWF